MRRDGMRGAREEQYLVVHDGTEAHDAEVQVVLLAEQTRISQSFPEQKNKYVQIFVLNLKEDFLFYY